MFPPVHAWWRRADQAGCPTICTNGLYELNLDAKVDPKSATSEWCAVEREHYRFFHIQVTVVARRRARRRSPASRTRA